MPKVTRRGFFAGLVALVASAALPKPSIANPNPTKIEALGRINTNRTLLMIRRDIEDVMRSFIFEYNDDETRSNVHKVVTKVLEKYSLRDYAVICDKSNNTELCINNCELVVDVMVKIDPAINYFYIPVRLTGMTV
jgi:hypothetical protein